MEPVTVGIMAVMALIFIIISLAAFKMLTKETTFEDVYGENAMRLFADERGGKQKPLKTNKNRTKNVDHKRKDHTTDKDKEKEKDRDKDNDKKDKDKDKDKDKEKEQQQKRIATEKDKDKDKDKDRDKDKDKDKEHHSKPTIPQKRVEEEEQLLMDGHLENAEEPMIKATEMLALNQEMKPVTTKKKNKNKRQTSLEEQKVAEMALAAEDDKGISIESDDHSKHSVELNDQPKSQIITTAPLEMGSTEENVHVGSVNTNEGVEKKGKKKRARHADDHPAVKQHVEQPLTAHNKPMEQSIPQKLQQNDEKKIDKVKPKKASISPEDINVDKLHTRLSAIDELEPEYLSFLANYLSDTATMKDKLNEENMALHKQLTDKEHIIHQCTEMISESHKKDAEIAHLKQSLCDEQKKYALFEQSVCSQLTTSVQDKNYLQRLNEQLKCEANGLKEELKKAENALKSVPTVDTTPFQQQIDMLRKELNNSKKMTTQLESELSQRTQAVQQMKADLQNREVQLERMKQANSVAEKRFNDAENASKMERQCLEAKLNETLKSIEELQKLATKANEQTKQIELSKQMAIEECRQEYSHQIDSLNAQLMNMVEERDRIKRDSDAIISDFKSQQNIIQEKDQNEIKKLNDQIAQLQESIETEKSKQMNEMDELHQQIEQLHKQYANELLIGTSLKEQLANAEQQNQAIIAKLEKELAEAKAKFDSEQASKNIELKELRKELDELKGNNDAVKISLTNEQQSNEEKMMEMRTVNDINNVLLSSNTTLSNNNDNTNHIDLLQHQLDEQQKRNNELREANYKVVEMSQKQEQVYAKRLNELEKKYAQNLEAERKAIMEVIKQVLPPTNTHFISSSSSSFDFCNEQQYRQWIIDAIEIIKSTISEILQSQTNEQKLNVDIKVKELEEKVERYRLALATVSSTIDAIELEAAEKEKNYEREITQLKKEINQMNNYMNSHGSLISDSIDEEEDDC